MRAYENDTELKIPSWYMKLPMWVLNMWIASENFVSIVFCRKRKSKLDTCKTKFYL